MELTHDDVKKILEIIDGATHLDQIEVVYGGFHLCVQRGRETESSVRATPPLATAPQSLAPSQAAGPPRRAEPMLIEVVKLFNSIKAGADGVVTQILAENAKLVEYNQVLIVISTVA